MTAIVPHAFPTLCCFMKYISFLCLSLLFHSSSPLLHSSSLLPLSSCFCPSRSPHFTLLHLPLPLFDELDTFLLCNRSRRIIIHKIACLTLDISFSSASPSPPFLLLSFFPFSSSSPPPILSSYLAPILSSSSLSYHIWRKEYNSKDGLGNK